jgi:hypothetical protein
MATKKPKSPMTVKDVLAALRSMPQDMIVELEGCDCVGQAMGVELFTYSNNETVVLLTRLPESAS